MKAEKQKQSVSATSPGSYIAQLRQQYGCGPVVLTGNADALYERHLFFDNVMEVTTIGARERFETIAHSVRDILSQRWLHTEKTYERENPKRVYYLSIEFLIGRSLANNVTNLLLDGITKDAIKQKNLDWFELLEQEPDAGLGNGGLGRLAACFLDSMATMQIPAMGYGLRYEYGIFKQTIQDGWQREVPDNWLRRPDPWEVARPYQTVDVNLNCSFEIRGGILRRFRASNLDWSALPDKVAIQLNDTHPTMAVPELMRILLDEAHLGWDEAWDLTRKTLAYTNHTLLPEALEKWPLAWFEIMLPRHLVIILDIYRRLLNELRTRFPSDEGRVERVSLVEEGAERKIRMANLAIVGSHSTNGVAAIHSRLLRTMTVKDLAEMFPERFSNKTNGVTPRRWLLMSNPALSQTITDAIGDGWMTDLSQLKKLKPLADDQAVRYAFLKAKREAKSQFADWLKRTTGETVDPDSIFDCQIKRIHEYKRQLLNAVRVVVLYNRLRENPKLDMAPRTFFFSGKAAPAYQLAKVIIKFINNLAGTIDGDPTMRGRLKVLFLPDYCVSLAERLIPASDVSNQISTAGYEASGRSNMKFMMNGALTIGTRDGATIEMEEEAGEENFFLFGLTAEEVAASRGWYNPHWHYDNEPETRAALDLIFSDHFSRNELGVFTPLRDALLTHGDYYMHLADLKSYLEADQQLCELYADSVGWSRKAILNVAGSGKFSSDRAIGEYAADIWKAKRCPGE